jgi:hypothetical protein
MPTAEIAQDGSVVVETLVAPSRGLARASERRRALGALVIATAASLAFAAVAAPRVDPSRAILAGLDAGPEAANVTPSQREDAVATGRKVAAVGQWMGGALQPSLLAVAAAAFLWLGFRVAGAGAPFRAVLAVAAHGMLPVWLAKLLAIPALLARGPVAPDELPRLLPSSLAAALPPSTPAPLLAAAGALDLFSIWALVLVTLGMARVSGASRARSAAVTAVLWLGFVAVQMATAAPRGP